MVFFLKARHIIPLGPRIIYLITPLHSGLRRYFCFLTRLWKCVWYFLDYHNECEEEVFWYLIARVRNAYTFCGEQDSVSHKGISHLKMKRRQCSIPAKSYPVCIYTGGNDFKSSPNGFIAKKKMKIRIFLKRFILSK